MSTRNGVGIFAVGCVTALAVCSAASARTALPSRSLFAPFAADDRARDLVDDLAVQTLEEMDRRGLKSAKLDEVPWSGDYWPTYEGGIARRYADSSFPGSADWKTNTDYLQTHADSSSVDQLSPAEKYDLLVGDANHTLTHLAIEAGRQTYERDHEVATWMGICHGWAPAAYMLARPEKAVEVTAADGRTKIRFLPADLKALASQLWANGSFAEKFVGNRCDEIAPRRDAHGRVIDPQCFDTNPATWHLAVVNQIGVARRSFVIDSVYDAQVWNQPIYSYSYAYFNPKTHQAVSTLAAATAHASEMTDDPYKTYRTPHYAALVGITMDVTYTIETPPTTAVSTSDADDRTRTVRYMYDIELSRTGAILGGEWYLPTHPDFMWTPTKNTRPDTSGDDSIDALSETDGVAQSWDGVAFPAAWRAPAESASTFGSPLRHVVDTLFALSRLGIGSGPPR